MRQMREPQDYVDLSNFVTQTAVRTLEAADADGAQKPWWQGHLQSTYENVRDLRVGGFFELLDNRNVQDMPRHFRVVAMAASPEGFISVVAYADSGPRQTHNGERVSVIHPEMLYHVRTDNEQEPRRPLRRR